MMHFVFDVMDRIVVKTLRLVNIYLCNERASVDASALELCCRRFEPALQPGTFYSYCSARSVSGQSFILSKCDF